MRNSESRSWLRSTLAASALALLTAGSLNAADVAVKPENPKVRPGEVNWHPDFETACKAAARSNRPVLLFQMMGNLDERFT